MAFPNEKELKRVRSILEKVEPSYILSKNATKAERLKHALCEKFVIYLQDKDITQVDLARKLNMDKARLNEIVRYRIDLFTIDKLFEFVQRLDPKLDIKVA